MLARLLKESFVRQSGRKILAGCAVIAGMTVSTAMLTLRTNIGDDLNQELRRFGANIVVRPAADRLPVAINGVDLRPARDGALLNESDLAGIKQIFFRNNVTAFSPLLFVPAQVSLGGAQKSVTIEGVYFERPMRIPNSERPFVTGMKRLQPAWNVHGAWPEDGGTAALAGGTLASSLGLHAGSTVTLIADQSRETVKISGILSSGAAEENEIITPLALAQKLAGAPGKVREVLVSALTKPEDDFARSDPRRLSPAQQERWMCSPYALSMARDIELHVPGSVAVPVRPVAQTEGLILSKLELLMLLITIAALAASALAIASVMTEAVTERRSEIALMKAIGAQDASIGWLFLFEASALGLGGGIIGFVLGEVFASLFSRNVLGHVAEWKPALIPVVLLLAAAITLLGSLTALRNAMHTEPANILRGEA